MRVWTTTVAVLLVLACGGGQPVVEVEHAVGAPIEMKGWTATVHGSRVARNVGNTFMNHAAGAGAELLLIDLSAENTSNNPMVIAGKILVKDADRRTFQTPPGCMFAIKDKLGPLEQIQPGLKKRGTVCFEVPHNLSLRVGIRPHVLARPQWVALSASVEEPP